MRIIKASFLPWKVRDWGSILLNSNGIEEGDSDDGSGNTEGDAVGRPEEAKDK